MKLLVAVQVLCCTAIGPGSLRRAGESQVDMSAAPSEWGLNDVIDHMESDVSKIAHSLGRMQSLLQLSSDAEANHAKHTAPDFDPQAAVTQMGHLGPAQMPAMVVLLKGMYSSWKDNIGKANKREKDEKKDFDANIKGLEAKKNEHKNDANWTKTYDFIEKYWARQRKIEHRQYHTVLKIAHAGMERFKTVMNAMEGAIHKKKLSDTQMRQIQAMVPPEVVLLQQFEELTHWVHSTRRQLKELKRPQNAETADAAGRPMPAEATDRK